MKRKMTAKLRKFEKTKYHNYRFNKVTETEQIHTKIEWMGWRKAFRIIIIKKT